MIEIKKVQTEEDLDRVRCLWREYEKFLINCFLERKELPEFKQYLEHFELEITDHLPGRFGPPDGCLILAKFNGKPAGCVGLMDLGDGICEIRRLFVKLQYRRLGIGKVLIEATIEHARRIGYKIMRLNTNKRMPEAAKLYRSLGFRDIEPYEQFDVDGMVFLELKL